jgi:hypothetical protein
MHHDNYDDGLVHNHNRSGEPPHLGARSRTPTTTVPHEPGHDDGLVHGHDWAKNA